MWSDGSCTDMGSLPVPFFFKKKIIKIGRSGRLAEGWTGAWTLAWQNGASKKIYHEETLRSVPVMWPGDLASFSPARDRCSLRRPEAVAAAATFWLPLPASPRVDLDRFLSFFLSLS